MELRHLRYFCAVAEEQSFTSAARRLHVSQSEVSGQVRGPGGRTGRNPAATQSTRGHIVVLAWRHNDPDAIRDGFLSLLRKSRLNIERIMPDSTV
jgi:hypothetical protein